jgi:hypothetical protein
MTPTPTDTAIQIATLLDRDPVMALQVKNFIPAHRLAEILGLTVEDLKPQHPYGEKQMAFQNPDPLHELRPHDARN